MATTPNMNLLLPDVGATLGPLWATELNAAFTLVDSHDHVVGQGVPVPTAGININADFPFNNFNALSLRSSRMSSQSSPLSGVDDLTCLYVSSGNLYYNNSVGNQIRITVGAGLDASTVGGFGGDYGTSTASAFYTSATSTFTFWQDVDQMAIMQMGPLQLANTDQDTNFITFQAPNGLSSSYQLTLPTGLPASRKIMTVDASGNIGDVLDVDNSTISISGNTILVPAAGITDTQIAASTITIDKLVPKTIDVTTAALGDILQVPVNTSFINSTSTTLVASDTIVTSGGPLSFSLQPVGAGSLSAIDTTSDGNLAASANGFVIFQLDGDPLFACLVGESGPSTAVFSAGPNSASAIIAATAGTHTVNLYLQVSNTHNSIRIRNCVFNVYEM